MAQLEGKTAIVVGASRGLGRDVAERLAEAGAAVVAVGRHNSSLVEVARAGSRIVAEAGDAADPVLAGMLLDKHRPDVLALVASAQPLLRPFHHLTWETFSINWNTDVRVTFNWLREALLLPLRPGSRIIVMSSGAALMGSPVSDGHAGAKATQRFLAHYAADESRRAGLGISVTAVLPRLTAATVLGRAAVGAYAARNGVTEEQFIAEMGDPVTPEAAGAAFLLLATGPEGESGSYVLTGAGLQPLT